VAALAIAAVDEVLRKSLRLESPIGVVLFIAKKIKEQYYAPTSTSASKVPLITKNQNKKGGLLCPPFFHNYFKLLDG
jgi:hypothetical protein|tara:strand:+ start:1177 stop:1407 length:231 start_codon:yes stop_codon:yes gene_type:complete